MNSIYFGLLTILAYLLATALQSAHLFGKFSVKPTLFWMLTLIGICGHGWLLYIAIETPEGQNLHWLIMLSFSCWLMNLVTLFMCLKTRIENLCVITFPLSALAIFLALGWSDSAIIQTKTHPLMLIHILISFVAMGFLILANGQAILMGWQHSLLKSHHPSPMLRILPPLQTMENLLFFILFSGLIFLGGSLLSGFFAPFDLFQSTMLPKTVLALFAFLLLALLLLGRTLFGWRGYMAVRLTLSGTGIALLSYFGTKAICL